ncbi:hypothetical protein [Paeniglutamicibacter sulfureus]|uniref:Uncharacterized protein n=1 Tax=Paeniglutamicibacter sulfureus TaxID=43666 RepID=A0ABU2BMQ5_9MICC|nr:hypothetical protein [Paeniglutamicibacter sulfureus]MDR7359913.1 hypothetical protein [Paeniglutamicibacter sulfureus]
MPDGAGLLPHVAASGIDPNGVVDAPVHDRVVADAGAGRRLALKALFAEHRPATGA